VVESEDARLARLAAEAEASRADEEEARAEALRQARQAQEDAARIIQESQALQAAKIAALEAEAAQLADEEVAEWVERKEGLAAESTRLALLANGSLREAETECERLRAAAKAARERAVEAEHGPARHAASASAILAQEAYEAAESSLIELREAARRSNDDAAFSESQVEAAETLAAEHELARRRREEEAREEVRLAREQERMRLEAAEEQRRMEAAEVHTLEAEQAWACPAI